VSGAVRFSSFATISPRASLQSVGEDIPPIAGFPSVRAYWKNSRVPDVSGFRVLYSEGQQNSSSGYGVPGDCWSARAARTSLSSRSGSAILLKVRGRLSGLAALQGLARDCERPGESQAFGSHHRYRNGGVGQRSRATRRPGPVSASADTEATASLQMHSE